MNAFTLILAVAGATPHVDEVVVFPDRAQVTRVERVTCTGGRTSVAFEAIPPAADPASLRATSKGGTVEGLRSEQKTLAEAYSKKLADLEEERRRLQRELKGVDDELARAQGGTQLANQYEAIARTQVSQEMVAGRPDTKAWNTALDAAMQSRLRGADRSVDALTRKRALNYELQDLERKASGLQEASRRFEYLAEVLVSCPAGTSTEVRLTYLVGGASWQPTYEARADESKGRVELTTLANVRQGTGEDWKGAKLILSTALPVVDATPPELKRLEVSAVKRDEPKKVLVRREEQIFHAQSGQGSTSPTEPGGMAARPQGISVQLEVPGTSDVRGDGAPVRLFVARTAMPARYAWRAVPGLVPVVYRVAEVTNTAPFPLLPGSLDTFRRSGFIGRYGQDRVPQGGAFDLTFGLDDAIKVKRHTVEEVKRDEGLFNKRKRFRYAYRIEVAHSGRAPEELEVVERVPVSELEDVEVEIEKEKTSPGYELRMPDGLVVWKVKLQPSEKKNLELAFHVDVPDSYDTGGL